MNRRVQHSALLFFSFLFFLQAKAQDTTVIAPPVEVLPDTVYQAAPSNMYQFKKITSAEKIDVRAVPDSDLKKLKEDEDYWYVNEAPPRQKKVPEQPQKPSGIFDSSWFKTLFWMLLIGGFVALLIWFLATSNISLFRKKSKAALEQNNVEEAIENIFETDFEKEIQKAIDVANYRMAIRLMYLRTLRDLSLHNLINYTHEKTNSDYLFQLTGSPHYKSFFRLTRDFEYTWYGHFPLSQEGFAVMQNDFNNFKNQLS
jgi:hypothetical protein